MTFLLFIPKILKKKKMWLPANFLFELSEESQKVDWNEIIDELDLTTSSGISQALQRFNAASTTFVAMRHSGKRFQSNR
jgi:hypothetical protein